MRMKTKEQSIRELHETINYSLEKQEEIVRILLHSTEGKIVFTTEAEEKGNLLEYHISLFCRQPCHKYIPSFLRQIAFCEYLEI